MHKKHILGNSYHLLADKCNKENFVCRFTKNAEVSSQNKSRLDPAVVEMVLDRYWNSPAREDWFNDVHEGAENLEPGQAQLFLSKHIRSTRNYL